MAAAKMTASKIFKMIKEDGAEVYRRMYTAPLLSVAHVKAVAGAYFFPVTETVKVAGATLGFGSK